MDDTTPTQVTGEQRTRSGAASLFSAAHGSAPFVLTGEGVESGDGAGGGVGGVPSVHYSSETVEWPTPQWLFDALNCEFGFTLDPCSTHENAKCAKHWTREDNGLLKSWQDEVVWMNPPYGSEIGAWMAKAHGATNEGATVVCLVPARTDTAWWHNYAMKHEIRLLRGRLTFEGAKYGAPFPSAVVVMRPRSFSLAGWAAGAGVGRYAPKAEKEPNDGTLRQNPAPMASDV